jgi:hypothetical protein
MEIRMTDADIHETFDYGYDPGIAEDVRLVAPAKPSAAPPPQANVNPEWLPPVGHQTTPSCYVWSSTYGCATFAAAQLNGLDPTQAANQASPIYTYIKVQEIQQNTGQGVCLGGKIVWCFDFLESNGGTASMQAAPVLQGCAPAWSTWGSTTTTPPDGQFQTLAWTGMTLEGSDGLANVRTVISAGTPIVYGTGLYTDFPTYTGTPVPYVGNGQWLYNKKTGKKAGHCMMIIGYDDTIGAVLIQNSFGPGWGSQWNGNGGYIWMSYATFQATLQGSGLYITQMQGQG